MGTSGLFWFYLFSLVSILANLGIGDSASTGIFILAGQSNMAGRGGVVHGRWDGYVAPQCQSDRRILRLSAVRQWEEAREPLHADIDTGKACGVGPGMAFANEVVRSRGSDEVVGLVPCAVGGTRIGEWERGSPLYIQLVGRAVESVKSGGTIRAVLWYQGESDTIVKQDAELYGRRLKKLFQDIRMNLMSPMLPIIQVALASGEGRFINTVRKAQFGVDLPNVQTVDAIGLALSPDNLHLTTESQVLLGKKMANAFLPFLPRNLSAANSVNTTTQSSSSPITSSNLNLGFAMSLLLIASHYNINFLLLSSASI